MPAAVLGSIVRATVVLALLAARCGGQASDDALLGTVNDLYVQAREFEDERQMLTALRTLAAAARLLPSDARVRRKLRQVHARVRAVVPVQHGGETLVMPVWVHETPAPVGEAGSADDMVRALSAGPPARSRASRSAAADGRAAARAGLLAGGVVFQVEAHPDLSKRLGELQHTPA